MARIEEISTITAKGQTTVPKAVRQALGVNCGGRLVYRVEGNRVTVHSAAAEHRDPVLASFLQLLGTDMAKGRNVRDLPKGLASAMRKAMRQIAISSEETLEGDVAI
ncbi:MAG: type II toxin-antitoxin system PrlF family antitoxin [Alphaproteobacteria bacterium]|nr:type II toxin-antitoxin system PrlF family antitoxin [Alphaproteobacteria bacterium]